MKSYTGQYIEKHQKETKRLLGIDYPQLTHIITYALSLEKQKQEEKETHKVNLIKPGGGRKVKMTKEDQIILTLVYLRHQLSFQILGILFQVSESTAHERFNYWKDILTEGLPVSLIEQGKKELCLEEIIKNATINTLLIDSE